MTEEKVLCCNNTPSIHYSTGDYFHIEDGGNEAWIAEVSSSFNFIDRWLAENDSTILQLIPYVVLYSPDFRIFSYQRKGGGEKRLDGLRSIGIGGHINPIDHRVKIKHNSNGLDIKWDTVFQGAIREVIEEIDINGAYVKQNLRQVGTMYTPVSQDKQDFKPGPTAGQVHLAVVYTLPVKDLGVKVREIDNLIDYKFVDNPTDLTKYERWSQLVWQKIDEIKQIIMPV